MQLPGMCTDPVRLSLDVTWWPEAGDFTISRRLWTLGPDHRTWQMEDMATSGSPIGLVTLPDRWVEASNLSLSYFTELVSRSA